MMTAMYAAVFLKGIVIGLAIAAPVGPIGALCIRRTIHQGRLSGLVSGLGAALADAIYGFIAAFGITLVSSALVEHRFWFRLIGSLFLLYLGLRTVCASTSLQEIPSKLEDLVGDFFSTFLLTLANPITILTFGVIFTEFGLRSFQHAPSVGAIMVAGVFLGSAVWWAILCGVVGKIRAYITPRFLRGVNLVSGGVILVFAAFGLLRVLQTFVWWLI